MNKKTTIALALLSTLAFSSIVKSDDIVLPIIKAPSVLAEGTQRDLTPAQIDELLPWAKDSKILLSDLLDSLNTLNSEDKLDQLERGIKQVVQESGTKQTETFMRYSLNRALVLNDIIKSETDASSVGIIDAKIRLLIMSVKMSLRYYDVDMSVMSKKAVAPYATFGADYFLFLQDLNKSIFDASAQYAVEKTALEFLQWDLYRDLNNQVFASQIVKINNGLKLLPSTQKLTDSQSISYLRQMKTLEQRLNLNDSLKQVGSKVVIPVAAKGEMQDTLSDISSDLSVGSNVLYIDSSKNYRIGKIEGRFEGDRNSIVDISGGSKFYKQSKELFPEVGCLGSVCKKDRVILLNDQDEERVGEVKMIFSNKIAQIVYIHNGSSNTVYRSVSAINKIVSINKQGAQKGRIVMLYNSSKEARTGKLEEVTEVNAKISYIYDGTSNVVYRKNSEYSFETNCSGTVCTNDGVLLKNDHGEVREGTVMNIFENGMAKISYVYNGSNNIVYRSVSDISKKLK